MELLTMLEELRLVVIYSYPKNYSIIHIYIYHPLKYYRIYIFIKTTALPLVLDKDPISNFQKVFDVNVYGVINSIRAQIAVMKDNPKGGSIVNNSSVAGLYGGSYAAPYCASKHAVQGLMKCYASEFAEYNVRVNNVNPGPIESEIWESLGGDAVLEQYGASRTKLKRAGKGEEIGYPVAFLLSNLSSYQTGTTVAVDGGMIDQFPDVIPTQKEEEKK
eukprot:TRINITY_DN254_c0_g2_i1.p1 TRINITY_DN254_c0_g2~~TRINITY_DN254_c0_g2_i1.p1  ORF type:complete len:218 (-),score=54.57 TRINITY_DN254_c0_g2_i1:213-866(-)